MPSSDPLVKFKVQTMPSSIDSIIRLMDTLQPNCHYFDRVKTKSRGDCSQLRSKLRKFANSNSNKVGVKHWVQTKKWTPPNNKALSALMVIIRDLINTSWPVLEENPNPTKRQKVDIPTLTEDEKKVVLIQYKKDNANDSAEAVMAEYEKFMYIKIKGGGDNNCTPSKKVDAMWHAHILSTREYFAFCERYNNKEYIHHNPALTNGRESYKGTLQKYKEYFGHAPSSTTIWPSANGVEQDQQEEEEEGQEEEEDEQQREEEEEDPLGLKQMSGESWDAFTNRWHTAYANYYRDHPNRICESCEHDWADGEFDVECEECVLASMDIEHDDKPELESPFGRTFTCG
jgi:hypothetical protein